MASATAGAIALGLLARAVYGSGYVSSDSMHALLWGRDIAHAHMPTYGSSPTPHPLWNALSALLAPLGWRSEIALESVVYLSLGIAGWALWLLSSRLFGTLAGVVAVGLFLTRDVVAETTSLTFLDIPFCALVLSAFALEARRPRAGAPVLGLLAVAGLLRPETWFIAGFYWLWMLPAVDRRQAVKLGALVVAPPLLWMTVDTVVARDPLYSFTGTKGLAAGVKGGVTGLGGLVSHGPGMILDSTRRLAALAALMGLALAFVRQRREALLVLGMLAFVTVAFAIPVAAGTLLAPRYGLLEIALLSVLAGAAVGGLASVGTRHHPTGSAVGVLAAVLLILTVPSQVRRVDSQQDRINMLAASRGDARALVTGGVPCQPIVVPYTRMVTLATIWSGDAVSGVLTKRPRGPAAYLTGTPAAYDGLVVVPERDKVTPMLTTAPASARDTRSRGGWTLSSTCGSG